jgi:branched-chain amino acid transport system permease protein
MNLVRTRLAVFTLSAGIAGFGGAIYAIQLDSINPTRFDLVVGLPIFMLTVVGGAGLIGGALFAGVSLYGLLPLVATLGDRIARLTAMAPALAGIGLGRNPSGAVQDMSEGVAPLRRDTVVLVSMLVAMAFWWVLRVLDVITNWPFVILLALTFAVAAAMAMLRARPDVIDLAEREPELEWVGITSPWTEEQVAVLDRELALDEVRVRAPA